MNWLGHRNILISLPIRDKVVASYLMHIHSNSESDSVIVTAAAAIKWLHSLINIKTNPIDSPIVQQILVSSRKSLHKPPIQKRPLSLEQLKKILDKFAKVDCTLIQLKTASYVCLKYALLLRHNEIAEIKANHITKLSNEQGFKIVIPKSKTDVFREGDVAFLSDPRGNYSPAAVLTRYMDRSGVQIGEDKFIFTPLSFCSGTKAYKRCQNRPLSYTRCRELFLDALKSIGIDDVKSFGLHSLRSGGASHLANAGISEELILQHGRWKTVSAKNRYVKWDTAKRLKVSNALFS